MEKECIKHVLHVASVNTDLKQKLLLYAPHKSSCHPIALKLLIRSCVEMMQAQKNGNYLLAATKLVSFLMILGEGYEIVFKENISSLTYSEFIVDEKEKHHGREQ